MEGNVQSLPAPGMMGIRGIWPTPAPEAPAPRPAPVFGCRLLKDKTYWSHLMKTGTEKADSEKTREYQSNRNLHLASQREELWKEPVFQGFVWGESCCKTVNYISVSMLLPKRKASNTPLKETPTAPQFILIVKNHNFSYLSYKNMTEHKGRVRRDRKVKASIQRESHYFPK